MSLELPRYLQKTIKAIRSGLTTSAAIHAHDSDRKRIDITAINRRLERLRGRKFVTRKRGPGRFYIYSLTAKGRNLK